MENLIALHNNNEQMWLKETENYVCEITDPKHPFFYNKEWYLSEMETERERVREFACLLEYHADSVVDSEFFSIANYANMGLGLSAKVDSTVDQLAEEIPGYLEIISEPLFQTLQILGHKSLYKYKDTDNHSVTLFAILYGPLSLVNSKQGVKIGFMQCNPVSHKDLYYEYKLQVTQYRVGKDGMRRTFGLTMEPFADRRKPFYSTKKAFNRYKPRPPVFDIFTKTCLIARVKMSWKGRMNDSSEARMIRAGKQIFIDYPFVIVEEPIYIDLTISEDEDKDEDEDEDEDEDAMSEEERT
jgi:hypothetical protein